MRSDALKKGPSRAPARAMLKATGLTTPISSGRSSRWSDLDRRDAVQHAPARARRAGEGGHARRGRHADRVQHHRRLRRHHDGHRGHARLAGVARGDRRLDRAGRRSAHLLDGVVALSGCDKTIPATVMALARLDVPGADALRRADHAGPFRAASDVTIQDVFEAVGAHAAGKMTEGELRALEDARLSGRGRLRRAVHRQHHGDRGDDARACRRWALNEVAGDRSAQGRRGARAPARWSWSWSRRDLRAEQAPHPRRVRERDRRGRGDRRLDQRGAAPARDRARGRRAARRSTTSTRSRRARRCSPISSRAAASPPST